MMVLKDFPVSSWMNFWLSLGKWPAASDLKAMLTPVTVHWDSLKLHDELMKEHTEMHSHK